MDTKKNKYLEVADFIKLKIQDGEYKVGSTIPPIRDLAKELDANPQTVNKATAYLASMGYLESRQGSGTVVTLPISQNAAAEKITMLVDYQRSKLLQDNEDIVNYHCKDIYLSFLSLSSSRGISSNFIVYDKDDTLPSQRFLESLDSSTGYIVQGNLPESYIRLLTEKAIPAVFINRKLPEKCGKKFGSVQISLRKLEDLINYLLTMGHRKFLYVFYNSFEITEVFYERRDEITRLLSKTSGDDLSLEVFIFDTNDRQYTEKLSQLKKAGFSAAVGYNDFSALEFYRLARNAKYDIPADFSVVGFDGIMAAEYAQPPLTTVRVNRSQLVREAFQLLGNIASGKRDGQEKVLENELVLRRSVGPAG